MSIPSSASYRSSSVGSATGAEPHHGVMNDLLKPGGEISNFIARAGSNQLLDMMSSLYQGGAIVDQGVEFALDAAKKQLKKNTSAKKYPEAKEALIQGISRAILDSGKIDPVLTKKLRGIIESADAFSRKAESMGAVHRAYTMCDYSVEAASALTIAERADAIIDILDGNGASARRRQTKDKLGIDEQPFIVNAANDEPLRLFRETLAVRIAGTISDELAQHLGEEIVAGSQLGKIKSFLDTAITHPQAHPQRVAVPSSSASSSASATAHIVQGHDDIDPFQQLMDSVVQEAVAEAQAKLHRPASRPGTNDLSSASGLTITTATTATTTTTTTTTTVPSTITTTTAPKSAKTVAGTSAISAEPLAKKGGQQILVELGYPLSLQKKNPKQWKEAAKLVEKFYQDYAPQAGSHRERLMQGGAMSVADSIGALSVISLADKKLRDRLAFEKNLSPTTEKALSKAIHGHSHGYAQRHPELLKGSSPVSTRTTIAMIRPDGAIVRPAVVSVSSPALGKNGAELEAYLQPDGHLDQALYTKARQAMTEQIILNVRDAKLSAAPDRVILSAAGMGEFIAGLSKEDAAMATKLAVREMADLIVQLSKENVSVVFTDKDDQGTFWKEVNAALKNRAPVAFVGALPGNWISDKDLVVNSTSGFYHPGHGGKAGKSLDGQFGDTLLFDVHVLRSIFHSVGLSPADLGQ